MRRAGRAVRSRDRHAQTALPLVPALCALAHTERREPCTVYDRELIESLESYVVRHAARMPALRREMKILVDSLVIHCH